jgi:hypothetical protein
MKDNVKIVTDITTGPETLVFSVKSAAEFADLSKITRPVSVDPKETGTELIAKWGDDNNFPANVIADLRKDPELSSMLIKKAKIIYSGGLTWGILEGNGETEKLGPVEESINKKIRKWLERSNINAYLREAAIDYYFFSNVFPELTLNPERTEIMQLSTHAAETCRYSRYKNGIIEKVFLSKNWPSAKPGDEYTKEVSVLDPWYDPAGQLKKGKKLNYIYPLSFPSPGSNYYQLSGWNAIRTSGWLEVSQMIPQSKKNLISKTLGANVLIEINEKFFELSIPGWSKLTIDEKKKEQDKKVKALQDFAMGIDNKGKAIAIGFQWDGKNEVPLVKFTPVKAAIEKGEYLEEGKEASVQKAQAADLHPALIGFTPNSGLGGAGSNIREAYNMHILMSQVDQDILLEPLKVVRDFNGWPEDLVFRFKNSLMTTLDAGKELKNKK